MPSVVYVAPPGGAPCYQGAPTYQYVNGYQYATPQQQVSVTYINSTPVYQPGFCYASYNSCYNPYYRHHGWRRW